MRKYRFVLHGDIVKYFPSIDQTIATTISVSVVPLPRIIPQRSGVLISRNSTVTTSEKIQACSRLVFSPTEEKPALPGMVDIDC